MIELLYKLIIFFIISEKQLTHRVVAFTLKYWCCAILHAVSLSEEFLKSKSISIPLPADETLYLLSRVSATFELCIIITN